MLLNIYGVINEQLVIGPLENTQALQYWIAAEVLNAKDESIFIHKEVLYKSVVSNVKNILMSKIEGIELKRLQHGNEKQGFAEIYGIIDKRKYILEQETKISQVEDAELDDAESVKSESPDICLSKEKKPVCEIAVEEYINYVMENRNGLINCFNKREMRADVINFRLMAIDTPISRNILSMIGESEVALMLKIFGSS